MRIIKNLPASIRSQLMNYAKQQVRPFNEILQHYALQRFLYRLSKSEHSKNFILKGAFLLKAWGYAENRPTMDIDLLGKTENTEQNIISKIKDIVKTEVEPDGLFFDINSILCEQISKEANYAGIRMLFLCFLDTSRISIQIDIGFGDVIYPKAEIIELNSILGLPAAKIRSYSRESSIAEKFHAMFKLGILNSRMKDFYDIWILSEKYAFDGKILSTAISKTFANRKTVLEKDTLLFTLEFAKNKQKLWEAFCKRTLDSSESVSHSFQNIIEYLQSFLMPMVLSLAAGKTYNKKWNFKEKKWKI
jgi:predicted nucleotidyltransferase component of viral defense system